MARTKVVKKSGNGANVGPLLRLRIANRMQSCTLAAIRDALLPKLMSGEIEVGQARASDKSDQSDKDSRNG